ncbi:MAG: aminopeptidase, partial [Promethearchaeota archaeon]
MFQISDRQRSIAKKVLDNTLSIQQNQVAVFQAGLENLDLAYAFAAECEHRGIETLVQSQGDYISHTKLIEAPLERFTQEPKSLLALVEVADWFILMTGSRYDNSIYHNPKHHERLVEVLKLSKWTADRLLQLCLEKNTHLVAFLDPNLQQAEALGKSYEQTREMFLASLDINYDSLTKLGEQIIDTVGKGGEIHLTCPKGTDLKLRADGRYWINDNGKLQPPSAPISQYVHNLPVGEVFVAPIEESAKGVIFPKSLPGNITKGVCIEFKGKEKAEIRAEQGYEFMSPRLEKATGNPYCIAEFAFGTNPCGDMLLATEKAYGTCHVAIGQNTWLGGQT